MSLLQTIKLPRPTPFTSHRVISFTQIRIKLYDYVLQTIEPESFVTNPILFGDFMKIGAEKNDRVYEELTNMDKLKTVLGDVCIS